MYRKRSARSRRDSQSVCDCAKIDEQLAELKRPPSAHRRQGAFDTLMVQECYYDRCDLLWGFKITNLELPSRPFGPARSGGHPMQSPVFRATSSEPLDQSHTIELTLKARPAS